MTALLADNPQPLPILGGPGMGKTTIALKALHDKRVAERFRERRWFVRCDGVKTRAELAAAIARVLDLPITPNVEPIVLVALAAAPAALVLDNGETPLDVDGAEVEELLSQLATIESLALVMTIRGHRRPPGVPWRATTEPERLTDTAAAETFIAASGKPQFANDPDLPRLLVVLDGVPLAVTLHGACRGDVRHAGARVVALAEEAHGHAQRRRSARSVEEHRGFLRAVHRRSERRGQAPALRAGPAPGRCRAPRPRRSLRPPGRGGGRAAPACVGVRRRGTRAHARTPPRICGRHASARSHRRAEGGGSLSRSRSERGREGRHVGRCGSRDLPGSRGGERRGRARKEHGGVRYGDRGRGVATSR